MKLNIYFKELAGYKKSVFFWSVGIVFFFLAAMGKYEGFANSGVSVTDMFKDMPAGVGAVFGIGNVDLGTISGWFSVLVLYLAIMLGVHAVLLGSGIIAKEETDKTAEFLFSKPVTRGQAFTAKILAAFTILITLFVVSTVASLLILPLFNDGHPVTRDVLLLMPSVFFIQLIFLAIGVAFSAVMRKPKRAGQLSAALLLATFILSAFVDVATKYDWLKYLTPFKYFDPKVIFVDGGYNVAYIIIALVFSTALLAISQIAFRKRDFNI
jgi:ABC-2 type transport system permease protein